MLPLEQYGVKLMSVGFLPGGNKPVIWRGPLIAKIIKQFLMQVEWGALDYLLVDMPPGTGDAQITLSQAVALTGSVIVSTPQRCSPGGRDEGSGHVSDRWGTNFRAHREHELLPLPLLWHQNRHF